MNVSRSMAPTFSHGLKARVKLEAKRSTLAPSYSPRMDVAATRNHNFRSLVDNLTSAGRNKREAAIELDLSPSYLSQLYGGKKMGDDVARKLETTCQLPHGWMDVRHSNDSVKVNEDRADYSASHILRITPAILATAITLARLGSENLDMPFKPETEEDAELVILAANYLQARKESKVTVDNVVDFTKRLRQKMRGADEASGAGSIGSAGRSAG